MTLTKARCALGPEAAEHDTWASFVTAMQAGSALFAAATTTQATVECRIDREIRTIPATGVQPHAHAGNWISAFWLAVTYRRKDRMTELCNVPASPLRASGAVFDEYIYSWIDTLQSYWLQGEGLGDKLVATVNGTEPETLDTANRELVSKVLSPPIGLFYRFVRQDHDQFNSALHDALRWHQEYWTADEERANSVGGLVALGPLAIACLAYGADFPIEVESDHLPKYLLERGWVGEFET
ncbi:immunity 49 family protein [Streptomyces sp. HNM0645]|uniref:immunity 49 family protein n=1 Tax=Streptomyces sp. HNM0645 TaxID=2782343 RepID=UPI0024B670AA|nr:immunity 49 family protein [Streptomyces sp. HNM0645]MDI9884959.1 immunity 49 family protein [Streptomyces sp. HNM0645]